MPALKNYYLVQPVKCESSKSNKSEQINPTRVHVHFASRYKDQTYDASRGRRVWSLYLALRLHLAMGCASCFRNCRRSNRFCREDEPIRRRSLFRWFSKTDFISQLPTEMLGLQIKLYLVCLEIFLYCMRSTFGNVNVFFLITFFLYKYCYCNIVLFK